MKTFSATALSALASLAALALPAAAQAEDGKLQVKLLGTAVLPDGKISSLNVDLVGLPANTQTAASDNVVPTVAIEYFFNDTLSLETVRRQNIWH